MEWLERLRSGVVAVDTAPFIYLVEGNLEYASIVQPFFQMVDRGEVAAVTSVLSVMEVLVRPLRLGDAEMASRYREILLSSRHLMAIPVNTDIAEEAARIRAIHNVAVPDAIHLATAISANASVLLTNDRRLKPLPGLSVITLQSLQNEK